MPTRRPQIRFTLRQLQYFAAVARTGQISLAAAESHVTQSTMTAAIAELERVLGHAAVRTRTQRRHADARRAPVPAARQQRARGGGRRARHPFRERSDVSGTLELAASYTVLGYFLLPFLAKFQKQHPGARIVPVERGPRAHRSERRYRRSRTRGGADIEHARTQALSARRAGAFAPATLGGRRSSAGRSRRRRRSRTPRRTPTSCRWSTKAMSRDALLARRWTRSPPRSSAHRRWKRCARWWRSTWA